ncbi:putative oxidoreductase [Paramagnetospirillum magnetotacticum MS-1]|uniref:Putative oxidoreductase n=1 Tax=Paramagnetospirillum magnetotacticum MS-1 TaxID=272627 RepID=A0A0C2V0X1_PARME|nr:putative oxidoreductase [Paramagnetospirillum magnetotacticum MS-1]
MDMRRFNRILAFDPTVPTVTAEAGATLGRLFDFLAPQGFQLAVQPGYPDITIGGAIGGNVHGKNPRAHGCFGQWVEAIELFHPSHGPLSMSREQNPDLFEMTIGGLGLTGVILRARLRLVPLSANTIRVEPRRVATPEEAADILKVCPPDAEHLYSWHDLAAPGRRGPGIVFVGRHEGEGERAACLARYRPLKPGARGLLPGVLRHRAGIALVNAIQWAQWRHVRDLGVAAATFPFAATPQFFALFGRNGFLEHQSLVPWERASDYIDGLRDLIRRFGVTPGLMVMKPFGGNPGLLRFEGDGLSIAVEVAAGPECLKLFAGLDQLDAVLGCRPNIIKDARLPQAVVKAAYPEYDLFRQRLVAFDPDRLMRSILSERIGL